MYSDKIKFNLVIGASQNLRYIEGACLFTKKLQFQWKI